MKSRFIHFNLIFLIQAFLLVGCDVGYDKPINQHRKPKPETEFNASEISDLGISVEGLKSLRDQLSTPEGRKQAIEKLNPLILNPKTIDEKELSGLQKFTTALDIYTHALLLELKQGNTQHTESIEKFKSLYLANCLKNKNQCETASLLKGLPFSSELIVEIGKTDSDQTVERYYSYVFLSFDLANRTLSKATFSAYLAKLDQLDQLKATQNKETQDQFFSQQLQIVSAIKGSVDQMDQGNIEKFLLKIQPWNRDENSEQDITPSQNHDWTSRLRLETFDLFVSLLKKSNAIEEAYLAYTDQIFSQFKKQMIDPLYSPLTKGNLFSNLKLEALPTDKLQKIEVSLYFKLYENKFSITEIRQILANFDIKHNRFELTKKFVQWTIAYEIHKTTQFMGEKFMSRMQNAAGESIANMNLFDSFLLEAQLIGERWTHFAEKTSLIQDYIFDLSNRETQTEISRFFSSIDKNISMSVTYALMLPLMVQMSKLNYNQQVRILWFEFVITAKDIMEQFFNGRRRPWFKLTRDLARLAPHEILESYHYALAIGGFKAFGLTAKDFLHEAYLRMMSPYVNRYRIFTQQNNEYYSPTSHFQTVLDYCKSPSVNENLRMVHLDEYLSPHMDSLFESGGSPGEPVHHSFIKDSFSSIDAQDDNIEVQALWDLVDDYRLRFLPRLNDMKLFYQTALEFGYTEEELQFSEKLEEAEHASRNLLTSFYNTFSEVTSCQDLIIESERLRIFKAYNYEKQYLKDIYTRIAKVKSGDLTLEELNTSLKFDEGFPDNYTGFDYVSEKDGQFEFHYHKMDYLKRVKDYLEKGYKTDSGEALPSIALTVRPPYFKKTGNHLEPLQYQAPDTLEGSVNVIVPTRLKNNTSLWSMLDQRRYYVFNHKIPKTVLKFKDQGQKEFLQQLLPRLNVEPGSFEGRHSIIYYNRWANKLGYNFFTLRRDRGHLLSIFSKLDQFNIYDRSQARCRDQSDIAFLKENCLKSVQVKPKRLVEEALGPYLFQNLHQAYDREMFEETHRRTRFSGWIYLDPTLFDSTSKYILSTFNFLFLLTSNEVMGSNFNSVINNDGRDSGRIGPRMRARKLYRTESADKVMLFEASKKLKQDIYEQTKKAALRDFQRIMDFESTMNQTIGEIAQQSEVHTNETMHFEMILNEPAEKVPWIEYILKSGEVSLETFHEETNNFFKD